MSLRNFDGSNFNFWKEQMQDYLIVKGQIDPIENENSPKAYKVNEWQKLDRIVRATIRIHLSEKRVAEAGQNCSCHDSDVMRRKRKKIERRRRRKNNTSIYY